MFKLLVLVTFLSLTPITHGKQAAAQGSTSCVRPEYEIFLRVVGRWKVQWRDRVAPGKYADTEATSQIESDPIGCLLVEHFSGTRDGQVYQFVSLVSFGNKDRLQQLWMDSAHREFLEFNGRRVGEVIRFEWERDMGNRRMMLRRDYRFVSADAFDTQTYLSPDSGATWDLVSRAQYTHQK